MRSANCHPDRKYLAKGLCSPCYHAAWHKANRSKVLARQKVWSKTNREKIAARKKIYREVNRERLLAQQRMYRKDNRKKRTTYELKRRQTNIQYRLSYSLRRRMNDAIRGGYKSGSAVRDLGCSIFAFKLFIENQFEPGMTWDNYGKWHLDHVLPLASFDLTDRQRFLEAANWLNYQPLWAKENLRKYTSLP